MELVAQGIANIASPLFGGIPATGAIARTATNIRSGARSPISGMVHALTLLVILLVAAPLASYIPLATLAAVLFVVAYNMGEWREIGGILQLGFTAIAVWLVTFALTVFADLTVAVARGHGAGRAGLHLSHCGYHHRLCRSPTNTFATDCRIPCRVASFHPMSRCCAFTGRFLFGTTEKLVEATANLEAFAPVVILRLRNMTAIDCQRHSRH